MANTIKWLPNTEGDIASYRVERGSASTGPFSALITVTHDLGGAAYDGTHFFYNDTTGTNAHWYRLVSIDDGANESPPTAAFKPAAAPPAPPAETVALTHDYGGVDAYKIIDTNGAPVNEAQIRVYTKAAYDANDLSAPVGTTSTDPNGKWQNTITVSPATTYTIYVVKPAIFQANTVEVTV